MILRNDNYFFQTMSGSAVLSLVPSATRSLKRKRIEPVGDEGELRFEETEVQTVEYEEGEPAKKVSLVMSGKDLMDNFGGSTKIFKQHLPHNAIFIVTDLKTVEIHGTDQAVYMDAKLLMQSVSDEEEEEEIDDQDPPSEGQPIIDQDKADEKILTTNFVDHNGVEINGSHSMYGP